jgi:hypothetical protein
MHLWLHNLISLRLPFFLFFFLFFIAIFQFQSTRGELARSIGMITDCHSHILRVGIVIIVVSVESLSMRLVRFRLPGLFNGRLASKSRQLPYSASAMCIYINIYFTPGCSFVFKIQKIQTVTVHIVVKF